MLREPPHNIEAEQQLLGAILLDNEVFHKVSPFLVEEHFFEPAHGRIFTAVASLINGGKRATPVVLKSAADEPETLAAIVRTATSPVVGEDMGHLVRDLAVRRSIITLSEELAEKALTAPLEARADDMITASETSLAALAGRGLELKQVGFADALNTAINTISEAYRRDSGLVGLPTGLVDLDRKLGGLVPTELVILAGRPSMGKSALATNIALNVARQGVAVGFFSVEMSAEQLVTRILGEEAGISSSRLRRGAFHEEDFNRVIDRAQEIHRLPIRFDETGGITLTQLAARARRWKRQHDVGLIVVDYLQLMRGSKQRRGDNRVQEISDISMGLKALAKELDIPILALSQLSRQVENRDDKRPQLSDLRESGAIEQDADVVMFVYREVYYMARTEPKTGTTEHYEWQQALKKCEGLAEIIIGKQRHGPTGTVRVQFNAALTKFNDLAPDERLPERSAA